MAALIEILNFWFTEAYLLNSCLVLIVYEYVITFGDEVVTVWKRKMNATSLLLISVRWAMLFNAILMHIPAKASTCQGVAILTTIPVLIGFVQTALFSALRVFAIWNRSYFWALLVLVLGLAPFITNVYARAIAQYQYMTGIITACAVIEPLTLQQNKILLYTTRASLIAADLIVLVLTWIRTFSQLRESWRLKLPSSVSGLLLRDGTCFFIALLATNIAQMATANTRVAPMSVVINVLPPILVNRFILNLRSFDAASSASQAVTADAHLSKFSAPNFRVQPDSFLGNIGEPLEAGVTEDTYDDDDYDYDTRGDSVEGNEMQASPSGETIDEKLAAGEIVEVSAV